MDVAKNPEAFPAHYNEFLELGAILKLRNPDWKLASEFCKSSKVVLIHVSQLFSLVILEGICVNLFQGREQ